MRGVKAKRLRRETMVPKLDLGRRPALYTHPIDPGPGRKEKRAMHNAWRASVARAARLRDQWAGSRGKGTPAEPIREAISRISKRGQDFRIEDDGRRFMPLGERRTRWKKWKGALVVDKPDES